MPIAALLLLAAQDPVDFEADVRPILEEHCVKCHGPRRQKAGLRLDSRAATLAGAAFGERAVVVPGASEASELYLRVVTDDEDERMPEGEDPLPPGLVETLRVWVDAGAPGLEEAGAPAELEKHWAYVAPARPEPPALSPELERWARTPLDRFVAARLTVAGLAPSLEADDATLVRRATLDLTGLPPTPAEVRAFVDDDAPGAWDRLIDRLLASPHYAEHQARFWLDLARYADTQGYEKDERRTMWRYRDWVIDAFARDLPFDRFTIEQLAGDLLPEPTTEQRTATGFHRNTMVNREGGTDPEEFRVAAVVDRVDTTGTVWLGATFGCARCHDHKFDPVTQREYYELFAFFDSTEDTGNSDEPTIPAPTPEVEAERERVLAGIEAAEASYHAWTPELAAEFAAWRCARTANATVWTPLRPEVGLAEHGTRLAVLNDDSVLAFGELPDTDTYRVEVTAHESELVTGLRLEVLTDASLPGGGPGRPSHRNFVVNELTVEVVGEDSAWRDVALQDAIADHSQDGYAAAASVDLDLATGWAISGGTGADHELWVRFREPVRVEPGDRVAVELAQTFGGGHLIGRFRVSTTTSPLDALGIVVPPALAAFLDPAAGSAVDPADEVQRADDEADPEEALRAWYRSWTPSLSTVRDELAALRAELPDVPTALVMRELAEPRETHVLVRGSFLSPGEAVEPGVPAVLNDLFAREEGARPDRLDLARWLVAPENPLTARVFVNRLWGRLFGAGLVATEDDFGLQGDPPTHPDLLDWLALEFARDWSVKELHRAILRSATYRQSSRVTRDALERDPANVWLGRAPRLRVDAETVRDVALAAGGLLSREIGGPSVFPPQPAGTWAMTYSADAWETSMGPDRHRRGLYTFWRRTAPYPTFQLFDAPSRELTCPRRVRTNTPLQALATLNDPAFLEAAIALGERMYEHGEDDEGRVELGFLHCVSRPPTATERERVLALLASERTAFEADPERAVELLAPGFGSGMRFLDPAEVAAWTIVANVLLNLDEAVTRG